VVRDAAVVLAALTGFGLIASAGELAHRRLGVSPDATRGVEHIAAGVFSACLPRFLTFPQIAATCVILTGVVAFSARFHVFRGIHDVTRRTWGELLFPVGLLALAILVPRDPCFVYGALVLGVSDGLAGLLGARFGRAGAHGQRRRSSAVGTASCFLSSALIGVGVLINQGVSILEGLAASVVAAALLTAIEASLSGGLDDLVLPTAAGTAMLLMLHILA